jgi:hypothetical protein
MHMYVITYEHENTMLASTWCDVPLRTELYSCVRAVLSRVVRRRYLTEAARVPARVNLSGICG